MCSPESPGAPDRTRFECAPLPEREFALPTGANTTTERPHRRTVQARLALNRHLSAGEGDLPARERGELAVVGQQNLAVARRGVTSSRCIWFLPELSRGHADGSHPQPIRRTAPRPVDVGVFGRLVYPVATYVLLLLHVPEPSAGLDPKAVSHGKCRDNRGHEGDIEHRE